MSKKIVLENFTAKKIDGLVTNIPMQLTDQQMEAVAEAIMQVLYNFGVYSNAEMNYDLRIDGGTKYYVHGTDVTVVPMSQEPYNRRIRNDAKVIKKQNNERVEETLSKLKLEQSE